MPLTALIFLNILINRIFFLGNCSSEIGGGGGWWFKNCHRANLNGEYQNPSKNDAKGIRWSRFDHNHSLKKAEMKVKKKTLIV